VKKIADAPLVPMAITALERELLENSEVTNLSDLTKLVPSLSTTATDKPAAPRILFLIEG